MRKLIFLSLLSLLTCNITTSQEVVHVKGIKCLDFSTGLTRHGNWFKFGYSQFVTDNVYIDGRIDFEYAIPFGDYTRVIEAYGASSATFTLHNIDKVYFNASAGLFLGPELAYSRLENKKVSSFAVGSEIGLSIEWWMIPNIAIVGGFSEYIKFTGIKYPGNNSLGHKWLLHFGGKFNAF